MIRHPPSDVDITPVLFSSVSRVLQFLAAIVAGGVTLAVAFILLVPSVIAVATAGSGGDGPLDSSQFRDYAVRSQVFASDGSLLATLHGVENREPVELALIPPTVVQAVLAVEDAEFYQHGGINLRGLTRALVENLRSGGVDQGGSTITQQLVKKALLTDDRVLSRKTKEIALAVRLEQQLTKDEILELYLNTVYFGSGAYGVQAAAETYWGRNVQDLGWAEGALLASVISNPVGFDPILHPEKSRERRRVALGRMVANGVITQLQADEFDAMPLPEGRCTEQGDPRPGECGTIVQPPPDSYFVEQVKEELLADPRMGSTYEQRYATVFGGGLRIYTTLDPKAQEAAQTAHDTTFPDRVRAEADAKGITTAMVSVESSSGAVRALIGGPGFDSFKYDIATHEPGRQTGSTFKTFVLLTALEQGILPEDRVGGGGAWPNAGGTPDPYVVTGGGGTLTSVTQSSSNGAFVRLGQTVGIRNVVAMANRLGVSSQFDSKSKSTPLGVFDVTPLEMASAYSAIPNGGILNRPYFIDRVESRSGRVFIEHDPAPKRAFTATTACFATQILVDNVRSGTGTNAQLGGQPAAGKTGTTESNSNTWFVGFTPYLTTAVWMGIPAEGTKPMGSLGGQEQFGGLWPAAIWRNLNRAWLDGSSKPIVQFPACPTPSRPSQAAAGADDPYGVLNGGAFRSPQDEEGSATTTTTGRRVRVPGSTSSTSSTTTTTTTAPRR
jgi:penicillin-binding protein 1A